MMNTRLGTQQSKQSMEPGDWSRRAVRCLPYALMLVAALIGLSYVHVFGANVLWYDDWIRVPILSEYSAGTVTTAKLWEPHNEHRIVFPRLVMLGLDLLTKANVMTDMYIIQFLLLAILAIFVAAFRQQFRHGPAIWLMVPMAFLVFSLRQHENMLWGFQIGFVLVAASAAFVFFVLSRIRNGRHAWMFGGAILAATVAAYSSLHGLLVWPVGLGQLLIAPLAKRLKIILMTLWAVVGAGEWLLYFRDWVKPSYHPAVGFSWRYLATAVGGALSDNGDTALAAGALILALTAVAMVLTALKRQWREQSFWLATIAFALATLGTITAGRSGFGVSQALSSRYATVSIPLVVAIYVIFASQSVEKPSLLGVVLTRTVMFMAVVGTGFSFVEGWKEGKSNKLFCENQQFVICTIDSQPDSVIKVFWSTSLLRQYVAVLKELKYNVFADPALCAQYQVPDPSLPVIATKTLFRIADLSVSSTDKSLLVSGWAVDLPAGDVAGGVAVVVDGVAYPTFYGIPNDEAAKELGSDKFLLSGFMCAVPRKELQPGNRAISLKILTHDRKALFDVPEKLDFQDNR
jgi:hypothetical protein